VHADEAAFEADVAFPAQFDLRFRAARAENRLLVSGILVLKEQAARHGDDRRRDQLPTRTLEAMSALSLQCTRLCAEHDRNVASDRSSFFSHLENVDKIKLFLRSLEEGGSASVSGSKLLRSSINRCFRAECRCNSDRSFAELQHDKMVFAAGSNVQDSRLGRSTRG
jgi:hypothetical protein